MRNSNQKILLVALLVVWAGTSQVAMSGVVFRAAAQPVAVPCVAPVLPVPAPPAVADFQPDQVIVELKPGPSINDVNARNGTTTINQIPGTAYYLVGSPPGSNTQVIQAQLASDPAVQNADFNYLVYQPFDVSSRSIMGFPYDHATPGKTESDYEGQRQLLDQYLGLSQAHQCSTGAGKEVALIDTGIDLTHPQLSGMIDRANGWNFYGNTDDPSEQAEDPQTTVAGHGTFIAGLIAIMAPGCRLMPIKAFSPLGVSDEFTVVESIKYATDRDADVINLSCGTRKNSAILSDAIAYARERKVIVVAAVGNDGTDQIPEYPASLIADVIGVASIETSNVRSAFSNYGVSVSVDAYGDKLISTYPDGGYALWAGTSFATPLTSGEAALILAANPDPGTTRQTIEGTAVNIDRENSSLKAGELGKGRINPEAAVHCTGTTPAMNPATSFYARIDLGNSGAEPGAVGRAELSKAGAVCPVQRIAIFIYGLMPLSNYSIVVNGYTVSGLTSSGFGGLQLTLSDSPGPGELQLPAVLNPVTNVTNVECDSASSGVLAGARSLPAPAFF